MAEPTKETSNPVKEKIDMDYFMEHFEDDMDYFMEHFEDDWGYELIIWD